MSQKHFLAPEVIQSSGMDCGPAALKALLEGYGVRVGYDRLREACQTDVDGTSIDVLERLSNELGVRATQQMLPKDALFELAGQLAPCLLITQLGDSGGLHFVTLWSEILGRMQLMDPATGRRWVRPVDLDREVYVHNQALDGQDWLEIIEQGPFIPWLARRLDRLGLGGQARQRLQEIQAQDGWKGLCAADAAARMIAWLVSSKQVRPGEATRRLFEHCLALGQQEIETGQRIIPPSHWFTRPSRVQPTQVVMRGVVLLVPSATQATVKRGRRATIERLQEQDVSLLAELAKLFETRDLAPVAVLVSALTMGSLGTLAELMIFRASSSLVQRLGVLHQRLAAVAAFAVFLGVLLLLDYLVLATCQRLGRQLEGRLRVSLLSKIPRLADSYFRSRLLSDMAQRAHMLYSLRSVPLVVQDLLRSSINLVVTVAAISLQNPSMMVPTIAGVLLSILVPLLASRWLFELEDRVQNQQGSLSRFYLDALAGIVPLRTHGAEQSLILEHQKLLADWFKSVSARQATLTWLNSLQAFFGASLSVALIWWYLSRGNNPQGLLLLLFWVQRIPTLGQSVISGASSMAPIRSSLMRVIEPLRSGQEAQIDEAAPGREAEAGVGLRFENVGITAGGQDILRGLTVELKPGEHVAIVGRSGAGKSSLLALLLGIHRPSSGKVYIDDELVPPGELFPRLRRQVSWVDPAVQLWNESLLANIQFGSQELPQRPIAQVVAQSDLLDVLDRLPEGFQTHLGDGGALVSGGEGQRVRLARALLRRDTRLALLDEPFRGLDRSKRQVLLGRVRKMWGSATLLCVTHDVTETRDFGRVLVVEDGTVVEDGSPAELLARPSRYRQLYESDRQAIDGIWSKQQWRRVTVQGGKVVDVPGEGVS